MVGGGPRAISASFSANSELCFRPLYPRSIVGVVGIRGPVNIIITFNNRATVGLAGFLSNGNVGVLNASTRNVSITRSESGFSGLLRGFRVFHPGKASIAALRNTLGTTSSLKCPILLEPDCIVNNRGVAVTCAGSSIRECVSVVLHRNVRGPILISGCVVNARLRISYVSSNGSILVPNVVRRVRHTNIRDNSSVTICPPCGLRSGVLRGVYSISRGLTLSLKAGNLIGVRCLACRGRLCIVRMGPETSHAVPCVDGIAKIPVIRLTAGVVMNSALGRLNCGPKLCGVPPCCTIGIPMFDFRGLGGMGDRLNPRVGSANRILNINGGLGRTLFGKLISTNFGVSSRGVRHRNILVAIAGRSECRVMGLTGGLSSLNTRL